MVRFKLNIRDDVLECLPGVVHKQLSKLFSGEDLINARHVSTLLYREFTRLDPNHEVTALLWFFYLTKGARLLHHTNGGDHVGPLQPTSFRYGFPEVLWPVGDIASVVSCPLFVKQDCLVSDACFDNAPKWPHSEPVQMEPVVTGLALIGPQPCKNWAKKLLLPPHIPIQTKLSLITHPEPREPDGKTESSHFCHPHAFVTEMILKYWCYLLHRHQPIGRVNAVHTPDFTGIYRAIHPIFPIQYHIAELFFDVRIWYIRTTLRSCSQYINVH